MFDRKRGTMRFLFSLLTTILFASFPLAAAPWIAVHTEHLVVIGPEAKPIDSVAPVAEEILGRVWKYWLPQDIRGSLETGETGHVVRGSPVKYALILYLDPETYWEATELFGTRGVTVLRKRSPSLWEESVKPVLSSLGLRPMDAILLPLAEDYEHVLAHEMTHLLQYSLAELPEEWFFNPVVEALLREGMAVWTEYALGYRKGFDLQIQQPVKVWLGRGGRLVDAIRNVCLFYAIGASTVQFETQWLSPAQILALFNPAFSPSVGLPEKGTFDELFQAILGQTWMGFFERWKLMRKSRTGVTPQGELVYELYLGNFGLREALLWPLLSPAKRRELAELLQRVLDGKGTETDLSQADDILREAWVAPTPEVLKAVEKRAEFLREELRFLSGEQAAARARLLFRGREREQLSPSEFLRRYVGLVNDYLDQRDIPPSNTQ